MTPDDVAHTPSVASLKVKIFADGADLAGMLGVAAEKPWIAGLTTNPTLMRKAGITDYRAFATDILQASPTSRSASRSSATTAARWSGRPTRSQLGRQRLRQDPRHQHPRRVAARAGPRPGRRGREAERDGADDPPAGARGSAALADGPRATSRSSPAASPTPAATRCR